MNRNDMDDKELYHQNRVLEKLNIQNPRGSGPLLIGDLVSICRRAADTWYFDAQTGQRIYPNTGERIMLMVTELSEAFEGLRKNRVDDHLPHRPNVEVELADVIIRIFDFSGEMGYDLGGAFWEKMAYNLERADHKPENRRIQGGKKF